MRLPELESRLDGKELILQPTAPARLQQGMRPTPKSSTWPSRSSATACARRCSRAPHPGSVQPGIRERFPTSARPEHLVVPCRYCTSSPRISGSNGWAPWAGAAAHPARPLVARALDDGGRATGPGASRWSASSWPTTGSRVAISWRCCPTSPYRWAATTSSPPSTKWNDPAIATVRQWLTEALS